MPTILIPARLGSTRFPEKVLAARTGKPLIQHVYERAKLAKSADRIVIATDSIRVQQAARAFGAEAILTSPDHPNGTSRLAEAAKILKLAPDHIVVNAQGDEPELEPALIDAAVAALASSPTIPVATAAVPFASSENPSNPNLVKVVTRRDRCALYFSRALIPYPRDTASTADHAQPLKHIGLYVYRRAFLETYLTLEPSPLERTEQLEQLRILHHGYHIAVATLNLQTHGGIDTPEQYEAFVQRWKACE